MNAVDVRCSDSEDGELSGLIAGTLGAKKYLVVTSNLCKHSARRQPQFQP